MIKIAVFSDSHRHIAPMVQAVRQQQPDLILHLGDHAQDARSLEREFQTTALRYVRGNCDLGDWAPEQLELRLEGVRVLMTHGHRYQVKAGLDVLDYQGRAAQADLVLFGHTHVPLLQSEGGMTLLNPGSIGYGKTYGLVFIDNGQITATLTKLETE